MSKNQLPPSLSDGAGDSGFAAVLDATGKLSLVVDLGALILEATYVRQGPDLILVGKDGTKVLIVNFFASETPPDLYTINGAQIGGQLAELLAGPRATGLAQAAGTAVGDPIGVVEAADGTVFVTRVDGTRTQLNEGDRVFQDDVVETDGGGAVGIRFNDGTSFSLGADARMVLDDFIYDPQANTGNAVVNVLQGSFSFVSGAVAKTGDDALTIRTPVLTIGVRGTYVTGRGAQEGEQSEVVNLPDDQGVSGRVFVSNQAGAVELNQPYQGTTTSSQFQAPSPPRVYDRTEVESRFGQALDNLPATDSVSRGRRAERDGSDSRRDGANGDGEGAGEGGGEGGGEEGGEAGPGDEAPADSNGEAPDGEGTGEGGEEEEAAGGGGGGGEQQEQAQPTQQTQTTKPPAQQQTQQTEQNNNFTQQTQQVLQQANQQQTQQNQQTQQQNQTQQQDTLNNDDETLAGNNNQLTGGNDNVTLGDGNDNVDGAGGDDSIDGGAGNDTIRGGAGQDRIFGGAGDDSLLGGDGNDTLTGVDGNDFLGGDSGTDSVDFSNTTTGVAANLTTGQAQSIGSDQIGLDTLTGIENLVGGSGGDSLTGDAAANSLGGASGNDTLTGLDGADTLSGGAGVDLLFGGNGNDSILAGDGADSAQGGAGNDTVSGDAGNDTLNGGAGDDVLSGGADSDFADFSDDTLGTTVSLLNGTANGGGIGADTLSGFEGVFGGSGADQITGAATADTLSGNAGADTLAGGAGADSLSGGLGADSVSGDDGNDTLLGGDGNDTLLGGADNDDVFGGAGDDSIDGGAGADLADGDAGNDTMLGGAGNDDFDGGADNDSLVGDAGDDILAGAAGNDIIFGGADNDDIFGGDGADSIGGGDGADLIDGDAGNDTIQAGAGDDDVDGGDDNDLIFGEDGADILAGGAGDDTIDGGIGADSLSGGAGADSMEGGADADTLLGLDGNDTLSGGDGDDTLTGDAGDDRLFGGAGADGFVGAANAQAETVGFYDLDVGQGNNLQIASIQTAGLTAVNITLDGDASTVAAELAGIDVFYVQNPSNSGYGSEYLANLAVIEAAVNAGMVLIFHDRRVTEAATVIPGASTITFTRDLGADDDDIDVLNANSPLITGPGGTIDDAILDGGNSSSHGFALDTSLPQGADAALSRPTDAQIVTFAYSFGSGAVIYSTIPLDFYLNGTAPVGFSQVYAPNVVNYGALLFEGVALTVNAGVGNDTLDGGDGIDFVDYSGSDEAILVNLVAGTVTGGADVGTDTVLNIEQFVGSAFADTMTGAAADDQFFGDDGADTLTGAAGADTLSGDAGADLVSGGDGTDQLFGGAGTDTMSGDAGADTIVGGDGFDIADYSNDPASDVETGQGVVVDLGAGTAIDGTGATDVLDGIEGAFGSAHSDELTGSADGNILVGQGNNDTLLGLGGTDNLFGGDSNDDLFGGDGDDTLEGGDGDDELTGGAGNDSLVGGDGRDAALYVDEAAAILADLVNGTVTGTSTGTDTLVGIEGVVGTAFGDTIVGDDNNNVFLDGGAGDDSISGAGGNDAIEGGDGNDSIDAGDGDDGVDAGAGNDTVSGGSGENVLNGGTGTDLVDYSGEATGVDVDLGAGIALHGANPVVDTLSGFENVLGTDLADTLFGDTVDNSLSGGAGDDLLQGSAGDDTLAGGDGSDTVTYDEGDTSGVVVNLTTGVATDQFGGTDSLSGIENVIGTGSAGDLITGDNNDNFLSGLFGADTLIALGGADTLDGGSGNDTLNLLSSGNTTVLGGSGDDLVIAAFSDIDAGDSIDGGTGSDFLALDAGGTLAAADLVHVTNMELVVLTSANAATITLPDTFVATDVTLTVNATVLTTATFTLDASAELDGRLAVASGGGNDSLIGGALGDTLAGLAGDDTVIGGLGANSLDGGLGTDLVDYSADAVGIDLDLDAGTAVHGTNQVTDTLARFENVIGTDFADTLFGDSSDNVLTAGAGDDLLRGSAGDDTLAGGDGSDTITYNEGDTSGVVVNLATGVATDQFGGTDSLSGIENVIGTGSAGDLITGNADANVLSGLFGSDTLIGGGGADTLDGGQGNDTLDATAVGDMLLLGDSGNDLMEVSVTDFDGGDTLDGEAGTDTVAITGGGEIASAALDKVFNTEAIILRSDVETTLRLRDGQVATTGTIAVNASAIAAATSFLLLDAALKTDAGVNLTGGAADILAFGTSLADTLAGGAGEDVLFGGDGTDVLSGGAGIDLLFGGAGGGTLQGGDGNDFLFGGAGNDLFDGGAGADDFVEFAENGSAISVDLNQGTATGAGTDSLSGVELVSGTAFGDLIQLATNVADQAAAGGPGDDTLIAGDLGDALIGQLGADSLVGGAGDDVLEGGGGDDTAAGGAGADEIEGGAGDDLLSGGTGNDEIAGDVVLSADLAALFDGSDDAVVAPLFDGLAGTDDATFEAWIRPDSLADMAVIDLRDDVSGNETGFFFGFHDNGLGQLVAVARIAGGGTAIEVESAAFDVPTTAHHFAVTFDRDGLMTMFVDGVASGTPVDISALAAAGVIDGQILRLGRTELSDFGAFQGALDELRIWSIARTEADIAADMGRLLVGDETGLVLYYDFDEEDVGLSLDHSQTQANGIFLGGTTHEVSTAVITEASFGNDTLVGGDGDDTLDPGTNAGGQVGFDVVQPGDGNDIVNFATPGSGFFVVDYSDQTTGIVADIGATNGTVIKTSGTDTLTGIQDIDGDVGGLQLNGGSGNDSVTANLADSTEFFQFRGGAGDDTFTGGAGFDRLDYRGASAGVNIDVGAGTTSDDGDGGVDTFSNVDEFRGSRFTDTLTGSAGDDRFITDDGDDTVDGLDGFDLVRYDRAGVQSVDVDLESGVALVTIDNVLNTQSLLNIEFVRGSDGNDTMDAATTGSLLQGRDGDDDLAGRAGDDNLQGEDGADTLFGDAGNDTLLGGAGDDVLDGGSNDGGQTGFDVIRPGDGNDAIDFANAGQGFFVVDYSDQTTGIVATIGATTGTVTKSSGTDTLTAIDVIDGVDGGLQINGGSGDDSVSADLTDANEFIQFRGGAGNDSFTGGNGFDRIDYRGAAAGVNVDIGAGTTSDDGDGGVDSFANIDEVRGSRFTDTLTGSAGDDRFIPDDGDDTVDGLDGFDLVRYDRQGVDSVNVDLASNTASVTINSQGFTHTLLNIEAVRGSGGDDTLLGDSLGNQLDGRDGNDSLDGGAGDDTLLGNAGDDTLAFAAGADVITGGAGDDSIIAAVGMGAANTVTDFTAGAETEDVIDVSAFGITDFGTLLEFASDDGTDTTIDFGGGDILTLLGVTVADLDASDFGLPGATGVPSFSVSDIGGDLLFTIEADYAVSQNAFGFNIDGGIDVDGDGFDDLLVSAGNSVGLLNGVPYEGAGFVLFGRDDGSVEQVNSGGVTASGLVIGRSDQIAYSGLGQKLSVIGDINGDGFDDFAVSAPLENTLNTAGTGEVAVIFGQSGGINADIDISLLDGTNGFVIRADDAAITTFGANIAGGGDFNGDGIDDLLIASPADTAGQNSFAGQVYVLFGSQAPFNAAISAGDIAATLGVVVQGELADGRLGDNALDFIGDFDGDGFDDFVVSTDSASGGPGVYTSDSVHVVYGSATPAALSEIGTLRGAGGARLFEFDTQQFGYGIYASTAGDFNGDGFDDFVVGSPFAQAGVFVVFGGGTFGEVTDLLSLGSNGLSMAPVQAYDGIGYAVSGGGDVNGDGFDDILIGASGTNGATGADAGAVYVVLGSAGSSGTLDLSALTGFNGFRIDGPDVADTRFGSTVAFVGDVDGDGLDDFAVNSAYGYVAQVLDRTVFVISGAVHQIAEGGGLESTLTGTAGDDSLGGTGANELLQGLDGNDTLDGQGGNDSLEGGGDNDLLLGGEGNDTIDPGANVGGQTGSDVIITGNGDDVVDFTNAGSGFFVLNYGFETGAITANIGNTSGTVVKANGTDTLLAVDSIDGANGGLQIIGGSGNDSVSADLLDGNEFIQFRGGIGNDTFTGGNGFDRLDYRGATGGVNVDIGAGTASNDGDGGTDTFSNIDELRGSRFTDTLTGSGGNDRFIPDDGDDTIDGLGGIDLVRYDRVQVETVNVDLAAGTAAVRIQALDFNQVLINIENVRGSDADDTLLGDSLGNTLDGRAGNDSIDGRDGDDFLAGGLGNDVLAGGAGNDELFGGSGDDTLLFAAGADTVTGGAGDDSIIAVAGMGGTNIVSDFVAGTGTDDLIDVSDFGIQDLAGIQAIATDDGTDTTIDFGGGDILTLLGVTEAELTADDFTFDTPLTIVNVADLDNQDGFVIGNEDDNTKNGFAIARGSDINGDGVDDILIGAPYGNGPSAYSGNQTGEAFVVFGQTTAPATNINTGENLSTNDGLQVFRSASSPFAIGGYDVTSVGDLNGDGFEDFAVSARNEYTITEPGSGEVAVIFGTAQGLSSNIDISALDGTDGFVIRANDATISQLGTAISGGGDFNGDGIDDLFITAPSADALVQGDPTGRVFVLFGDTAGFAAVVDVNDPQNGADIAIAGSADGGQFGRQVDMIGDFNGDGLDDILVTEPGAGAGLAHVIFGNSTLTGSVDLGGLTDFDEAITFSLGGGNQQSIVGARAGDFNGDGFDDIVVGAYRYGNYYGTGFVVFGSANRTGTTDLFTIGDGTNGIQILGPAQYASFGFAVDGGGDINGDGFDDVVFGSPGTTQSYNQGTYTAGSVFVLFGGSGRAGQLGTTTIDGTTFIRIDGSVQGGVTSQLGRNVAIVGDVNGDGLDDIAASSYYDLVEGQTTLHDATYVLFGIDNGGADSVGGSGNDLIAGDSGNNALVGGQGDDTITGDAGNDTIKGALGFDSIDGGGDDDDIFGGADSDFLNGGFGDDLVSGDGGDDVLVGDGGNDTLDGGAGVDLVDYSQESNIGPVLVDLVAGTATDRGSGSDILVDIENVTGTDEFDVILGNDAGNMFEGRAGDDSLVGGGGADTLVGGAGGDTLVGDAGADIFGFASTGDTARIDTDVDIFQNFPLNNFISDFETGTDLFVFLTDQGFDAIDGTNTTFQTIGQNYDGTNSGAPQGATSAYIFDGSFLYFDDDLAQPGYQVIADMNGNSVAEADLQFQSNPNV